MTCCIIPPHKTNDYYINRAVWLNQRRWEQESVIKYHLDTNTSTYIKAFNDALNDWQADLAFQQVEDSRDAEIRVGFEPGGSWSYIGTDALSIPSNRFTMNFGWSITQDYDTALHEIGHMLGRGHEHQNPRRGIVIDRKQAYRFFFRTQGWDQELVDDQIMKVWDYAESDSWDPDSIMHYKLPAAVIYHPQPYSSQGINPDPGLSQADRVWVKQFYPKHDVIKNKCGFRTTVERAEVFIEFKDLKKKELFCGQELTWRCGECEN